MVGIFRYEGMGWQDAAHAEAARRGERSEAGSLAAQAGLFEQQVQFGDLLAQLITLVLQLAQFVAAHSDIEGLGGSSRHVGTQENTSQFGW